MMFKKLVARLGWERLEAGQRPLAVAVLVLGAFGLALPGFGVFLLVREQRATHVAHSEPAHEGEHSETQEGEEGGGLIQIARDIPKEILDRQDGQMEPGHDLVEPEIKETRGLASLLNEPPKEAALPNRFVALDEIFSGSRVGMRAGGAVVAEIVLEVDTYATEQEVTALKSQFRAVIASLISETQQEQLKDFQGKADLKRKIQKELNLRLKKGRVTDVLFTSFVIR